MCFKLIISERKPEFFAVLADVFSDVEGIVILDVNIPTLHSLSELDAVVMRGIFAHERYGGDPQVGKSQILGTRGETNMPPWVITTPPFPAHIEKRRQPDNSVRTEIVRDKQLTPEEEDYIIFSKVFKRIEQFNQQFEEPTIKTVGLDLKFLGIPRLDIPGDIRKEAEAILKAYLDSPKLIGKK